MDAVESPVVPWNDRRIDASANEFCDNHRTMNKLLEAYYSFDFFGFFIGERRTAVPPYTSSEYR